MWGLEMMFRLYLKAHQYYLKAGLESSDHIFTG